MSWVSREEVVQAVLSVSPDMECWHKVASSRCLVPLKIRELAACCCSRDPQYSRQKPVPLGILSLGELGEKRAKHPSNILAFQGGFPSDWHLSCLTQSTKGTHCPLKVCRGQRTKENWPICGASENQNCRQPPKWLKKRRKTCHMLPYGLTLRTSCKVK